MTVEGTEEKAPFDFYTLGEPEPAEETDTPGGQEEEVEEAVTETEVDEPGSDALATKAPYTSAEIAELIQGDSDIDTTRLSPEGQAVMKAMQKGFTPKLQEAAEARKELERIRQEIEAAKPKAQPKDIYEAYDQDPEGVVEFVNSEIAKLATEDAYGNAANIERLRDIKYQFQTRESNRYRDQQKQQMVAQGVMQEILKNVPDIVEKQTQLKDFAINVMGFTEEELARETSPTVGMSAATTIKRINQAYTKFNAGKTAQTKAVKPVPTKVEKAGQGFTPTQTGSMKDQIKQAKESGDWSSIFLNLDEE